MFSVKENGGRNVKVFSGVTFWIILIFCLIVILSLGLVCLRCLL